MPEAFPIVHDMVWWRRGQDLASVVVTWIPAYLEDGPQSAPTETPDPQAWAIEDDDEPVIEALVEIATSLDEQLVNQ